MRLSREHRYTYRKRARHNDDDEDDAAAAKRERLTDFKRNMLCNATVMNVAPTEAVPNSTRGQMKIYRNSLFSSLHYVYSITRARQRLVYYCRARQSRAARVRTKTRDTMLNVQGESEIELQLCRMDKKNVVADFNQTHKDDGNQRTRSWQKAGCLTLYMYIPIISCPINKLLGVPQDIRRHNCCCCCCTLSAKFIVKARDFVRFS